jgi:hypothetical protein
MYMRIRPTSMASKLAHRFVIYLGALFAITGVATFALVFLAYPMQTLLSGVALFVVFIVGLYAYERTKYA